MSERPWFRFFPTDWLADTALQSCSIAARGLWINCLAIMHSASPRGHLCLPGGQMIDAANLSMLCHLSTAETRKLLGELRKAEVFSITDTGVIFSRKMVRDEAKSRQAKEAGKKGGNPQLSGKVVPLRLSGGITTPLKPQWHLASGLSKEAPHTSQEEAQAGEDSSQESGPFTRGAA
jgi:hypothetical protein